MLVLVVLGSIFRLTDVTYRNSNGPMTFIKVFRVVITSWIICVGVFTFFGILTHLPKDFLWGIPLVTAYTHGARFFVCILLCSMGWDNVVRGLGNSAKIVVTKGSGGKKHD
jgi:hypothetical protein